MTTFPSIESAVEVMKPGRYTTARSRSTSDMSAAHSPMPGSRSEACRKQPITAPCFDHEIGEMTAPLQELTQQA
jgi:hypothetical protein